MSKQTPVLSKKDLRNASCRWFIGPSTFNYETQLAPSVVFALYPSLRKIYKDDDDLIQSINNHYKYFNTNPWVASLVLGAALAIEDENGLDALNTVQDFKVSLMGPLAGIGDTILWAMIPTIFGSIAAYMAQEGSPLGVYLWTALTIGFFFVRTRLFEVGYKQGVKMITEFGKHLTIFTEAVSVLGLMVVGAILPSTIALTTGITFKSGDVVMEIQPLLDVILPALLPVILVAIIYFLMSKKKIKMMTIILFIIILAMVGAATGILV